MNKIERVEAILKGDVADKIPAGFWYHYEETLNPEEMAKAHLKTFRETNPDIYKIMQDYIHIIDVKIDSPKDWEKVDYPGTSSPTFIKLKDVISRIIEETGHDALIFQTLFGPLKTAVQTFGYDLVMNHLQEAPDLVVPAVNRIAQSMKEWAVGFLEAGADGIFYPGQFSEPGRFTKEEFEKYCGAADLIVLDAVTQADGKIILHICGEHDYEFRSNPSWYTSYPFNIVNWSVKDTGISLLEGRKLFNGKPILGGLNNRGTILHGDQQAIKNDIHELLESISDKRGFMLGADCTIQGENIDNSLINFAIETVHKYH